VGKDINLSSDYSAGIGYTVTLLGKGVGIGHSVTLPSGGGSVGIGSGITIQTDPETSEYKGLKYTVAIGQTINQTKDCQVLLGYKPVTDGYTDFAVNNGGKVNVLEAGNNTLKAYGQEVAFKNEIPHLYNHDIILQVRPDTTSHTLIYVSFNLQNTSEEKITVTTHLSDFVDRLIGLGTALEYRSATGFVQQYNDSNTEVTKVYNIVTINKFTNHIGFSVISSNGTLSLFKIYGNSHELGPDERQWACTEKITQIF
jgi:hypothetical protein